LAIGDNAPMHDRDQILTPSQLNTLARDLLEGAFPLVWVEAELGNVTRPASGHLYFTLKDARAQVRCAMFRPKSQWLKFQPREGLRVLARGRLTLYEARGDYQMVLDHLEEAGEGALRRAFEQLHARLQAEGLFDQARKRTLPRQLRRLAIITSPSGAAVHDVLSVLARRYPLLQVELLPTLVQGDNAAAQITALLRRADACARYDAILITRGGGSLEDLWAFNDEQLARAIAACQTPVVSAIGHETDFTLADFAADLRAPTPSVAAELLAPDQRALATQLRQLGIRIEQLQQHRLNQAIQRLDRASLRLAAQSPQNRLQMLHRRQHDVGRRLHARATQILERLRARLLRSHTSLRLHDPSRQLQALRQRLQALRPQVLMQQHLQRDRLRLHGLARSLEAVSPLATVARGYAIVSREQDGALVRSAAQVSPGERLHARLAEGAISVVVVKPGD
jgi:exodeoxyribonuclease VII large subunit